MHFVRRAASRAASASPSTSFLTKARSARVSPSALRTNQQSIIAQTVSKRFYSEERSNEQSGEKGTVAEAVDGVKEYASEVAGKARGAFNSAAETASEWAPRGFEGEQRVSRKSAFDRSNFRREVAPSPSVYIGNLLFDVTAAELETEFAQYGEIEKAVIATDERGLSKGFGYVTFKTVEQATAAIESRHQSVYEGRRIVVNYQLDTTRRAPRTSPTKTLFIGNIAFEMSDADLNKLFRDIRNVTDVRVAVDRRTGQPRGFAHADFTDVESAQAARDALLGKEIYGRKLRVDYSAGARRERGGRGADVADEIAPPLEP